MSLRCQNCGRQIAQTDAFCKSCGAPNGARMASYQAYPYPTPYNQRLTSRKSKTVSILLAFFLTFWTWLYTYKRDGGKFWFGLILSCLPGLIAAIRLEFYISTVPWLPDNLFIALSYILPMLIWLWAIADTVGKRQEWYYYY